MAGKFRTSSDGEKGGCLWAVCVLPEIDQTRVFVSRGKMQIYSGRCLYGDFIFAGLEFDVAERQQQRRRMDWLSWERG